MKYGKLGTACRLTGFAFTTVWLPSAIIAADYNGPSRTLTPNYRYTQVQGHLFGMGLISVPDYVKDQSIAFPYRLKPGQPVEVPFADKISIVRVLGGYTENAIKASGRWSPVLTKRSLDYTTRGSDGVLDFHPALIEARIRPYLKAGYKPSDITLALDNVPWDLTTPNGQPATEGIWGRNTPPGDLAEWALVMSHFANDLKALFGTDAGRFSFKTGVEYNQKSNFAGSSTDFINYYRTSVRAIRDVLPDANVSPGEFTGIGDCTARSEDCVYDNKLLFSQKISRELQVSMLPRSLNSLLGSAGAWPKATENRFFESYARIPTVKEQIPQFGLLLQPFGEGFGSDPGPRSASWELENLALLLSKDDITSIAHWGGFVSFAGLQLINGTGFLRLILDNCLGMNMRILPVEVALEQVSHGSSSAFLLSSSDMSRHDILLISRFNASTSPNIRAVQVSLPNDLINRRVDRILRYKQDENVFSLIKENLRAEANLNAEFARCANCIGSPAAMAIDVSRGRSMVQRNQGIYTSYMKQHLKWSKANNDVLEEAGEVRLEMQDNELDVLELNSK